MHRTSVDLQASSRWPVFLEEQPIDAPVEPQAGGTFTAARKQMFRAPVLWGVVFGGIQAASPLGFGGWIRQLSTRSR
jgi:hypothetical protein